MSEEKKRVQNPKLNLIGLSQEIQPNLWDWSDDEKKALASFDAERMGEVIHQRLVGAGYKPTDLYVIIHDKDSSEKWDEKQGKLVTVPTRPHIHAVIRFKRGHGDTLEKLAQVIGLEPQFVEKAGRGRYAFDNMQSYLVHAKDADKYQYDPDEVATILGKSYRAIYEENKARWYVGRAKKQRSKAAETFDGLWEKCFNGEVEMEDILQNDEYRRIYAQNKRQILDALGTHAESRAYQAAEALRNGVFKLSVIYVYGAPGAGKSVFARKILDRLKEPGWDVYEAASQNALDDWDGEEMILMDDLRGAAMSASDWLKLLDPEHSSPVAARYNNKQHVAPRVVVLTSSVPAEIFFRDAREGESEAMDQFMRRLTMRVEVVKTPNEERLYQVEQISEIGEHLRFRELVRYGSSEAVVLDEIDEAAEVVSGMILNRNNDVEELPGVDWEALPKREVEVLWKNPPQAAIGVQPL